MSALTTIISNANEVPIIFELLSILVNWSDFLVGNYSSQSLCYFKCSKYAGLAQRHYTAMSWAG